ncbi:hypothetical protein LP419_19385 [Massilia sp. H-1]|nr:hypothetical protein LP419_19385 [Massilia sp. H-1]
MNALPQLQGAFQDYVLGQGAAAPAAARCRAPSGARSAPRPGWRSITTPTAPACAKRCARPTSAPGPTSAMRCSRPWPRPISMPILPASSNLRWFGGGFPAFLAQELADYPWVAELAGFEWTLGLAFDAPDAPEARLDALRALAPEAWADLRFALHPSVHLLPMFHNSVALWQALGEERAPPRAGRAGRRAHLAGLAPCAAAALSLARRLRGERTAGAGARRHLRRDLRLLRG